MRRAAACPTGSRASERFLARRGFGGGDLSSWVQAETGTGRVEVPVPEGVVLANCSPIGWVQDDATLAIVGATSAGVPAEQPCTDRTACASASPARLHDSPPGQERE